MSRGFPNAVQDAVQTALAALPTCGSKERKEDVKSELKIYHRNENIAKLCDALLSRHHFLRPGKPVHALLGA
jgi:hypothetical protein